MMNIREDISQIGSTKTYKEVLHKAELEERASSFVVAAADVLSVGPLAAGARI